MNQLEMNWRDVFHARTRAAGFMAEVCAALRGRGTLRDTAHELDQIFGPQGRPVSESVLRAATSPECERNYLRAEWLVLVLDDPHVQRSLRSPVLTPEEECRLTREYLAVNAPGVLRDLNRTLGRNGQ